MATERAQALWDRAYEQAAQNAENGQKNTAREGGKTKHAIVTLENGWKYVKADRQVIFGNDQDSWREQIENYINGKIRKGENIQLNTDDGDILVLTSDTAGKISSKYDSHGRPLSDKKYEVKINAGTHIDELVKISKKDEKIVMDYNSRHGDKAKDGWTYRNVFFMDFDDKYYSLTLSVMMGDQGKLVYNIGQIDERSAPLLNGSSAEEGGALKENTSLKNSVPNSAEEVKGKFSLAQTQAENDANYKKFAEDGDLKNAGRMVQAAAEAAGYTIRAYHGTTNAEQYDCL